LIHLSARARGVWANQTLWLGLIVLLGLVLRMVHIGRASLWNDELFSVFYSRSGLHFMWTEGLSLEPDPPLYYTLLLGWQRVWGISETAIRSLSTLFSLLAIPLVYALGVELQDRRTALTAAFLLAVAPMQLDFAQDARAYSLTVVAAGLMLLGLARYFRQGPWLGNLACYAAGAVIGIYTHTSVILLIIACNIAALGWVPAPDGPRWPRDAVRWLVANIAVAAIGIPEALAIFNITTGQRYAPGRAALTLFQFADMFSELIAGPAAPLRFPGLEVAALGLLVAALGLWLRPLPRRSLVVLVGVPIGFFAIALAVTLGLHKPIFVARIFCWMSIPVSLLLAHAILQPRYAVPLRAAVAVVFLVGLGAHLGRDADPIEPWRSALPKLKDEMARADLVVLMPYTSAGALVLYAPEVTHLAALRSNGPETVETGFMHESMGVPLVELTDVARQIRAGKDVWTLGQYRASELDQLLVEVPPPTQSFEQRCPNGQTCILALHWNPAARNRAQPQ